MKIKHLVLVVFLISNINTLSAQECDGNGNGITTNPQNPINPLHPLYENIFDWTQNPFDCFYFNQYNTVPNPYVTGQGGVYSLYPHDDYKPEDGWELVYADLGLDRYGNESDYKSGNLVFVLYNKYRSILRVFTRIVQISGTDIIEIELEIKNGSSYNTGILASLDNVRKPLIKFNPNNIASNTQQFINLNPAQGFTHWYYADFPINYDPCTCTPIDPNSEPPELRLSFRLVDITDIELVGKSTGNATMVEKTSTSQQSNWNRFFGANKKLQNSIEAGSKAFKTYQAFANEVVESADDISNGNAAKSNDIKSGFTNIASFLTNNVPLLSNVPYVAEALAILGSFTGGGKPNSPQEVRFPPLSIELEHLFTGTLTSNHTYGISDFYIPGSVISNPPISTGSNYNHKYPIYNEVLGLYTLLEKPKIDIYYGETFSRYDDDNQLPDPGKEARILFNIQEESVKLALNPASNLILKEAFIQVSALGNFYSIVDPTSTNVTNNTGISMTKIWTSKLIPISCISDQPIYFDYATNDFAPDISDVTTSIILFLEDPNGNKYVHKSTWETEWTPTPYPYQRDINIVNTTTNTIFIHIYNNWFNKPTFINKDYSFYLLEDHKNLSGSITQSKRAKETILIENATIYNELEITAGQRIDIKPNTTILPQTDIYIYTPMTECKDNEIPLASWEDILDACNSPEYISSKIHKRLKDDEYEYSLAELNMVKVSVFPNPVSDYVSLDFENIPRNYSSKIFITDMNGRLLLSENIENNRGFNNHSISVGNLSAGIYILHIPKLDGTVQTEKLIIQ
jgi:hypothetical protein